MKRIKCILLALLLIVLLLCIHIVLLDYCDSYLRFVNKIRIETRVRVHFKYWSATVMADPYQFKDDNIKCAGWQDSIYIVKEDNYPVYFLVAVGYGWKKLDAETVSWLYPGETVYVNNMNTYHGIQKINGEWYIWAEYPIEYEKQIEKTAASFQTIDLQSFGTKDRLVALYRFNGAIDLETVKRMMDLFLQAVNDM